MSEPRVRGLLHKYRCLNWKPTQILGSAFSPSGKELAIAREDRRIEIWSIQSEDETENWVLSKVLRLKTKKDRDEVDLRCLAWCETQLIVSTKEGNKIISYPRLFSAGMDGVLSEWSMYTLTVARDLQGTGGAIWDLKTNPSRDCLAAACEDGSVRLYGVEGGGGIVDEENLSSYVFPQLSLKSVIRCLSTAVMSVCWLPRVSKKLHKKEQDIKMITGDSDEEDEEDEDEQEEEVVDRIATGGLGVLKIHSITHTRRGGGTPYAISYVKPVVESVVSAHLSRAHGATKGKANRKKKNEQAVCWKVASLNNSDLVTVDSYGQVSFWCGKTGTLIKAITQTQYEVVALAVDAKHNRIFAGDIGGEVFCYECRPYEGEAGKREEEGEGEWVVMGRTKPSPHDVSTISLSPSGKVVVVGSRDCHVRALSGLVGMGKGKMKGRGNGALLKLLRDFPPSLYQKDVCHVGVVDNKPALMTLLPDRVEITMMEESNQEANVRAVLLSQLKLNQHGLFLVGTKDMSMFAIGYLYHFTLYSLTTKGHPMIKRIHTQNTPDLITDLIFSQGNKGGKQKGKQRGGRGGEGLMGVVHANYVEVYTLDDWTKEPRMFSLGESLLPTTITKAVISAEGGLLAVADSLNNIHIFNLSNGGLVWTKPIDSPIATLAFQQSSLLVTTPENRIFLLDALVKSESEWTKEYGTQFPALTRKQYPIIGSSFHPTDSNLVCFWGWDYMVVYHFEDAPVSEAKKQLKRKHSENDDQPKPKSGPWRIQPQEHLLHVDWVSRPEKKGVKGQEMLVVKLPWSAILQEIAPPIQKAKFLR